MTVRLMCTYCFEQWLLKTHPDLFEEWELEASEWLELDEWLEREHWEVVDEWARVEGERE